MRWREGVAAYSAGVPAQANLKSSWPATKRTAPSGRNRHRVPARAMSGFDPTELIADFTTACISRALDDREITLQKQSKVFFQISGAGHEVLLTAMARSLRSGNDWFFPYYRDRALVLSLGVPPLSMLLQSVGSSQDPSSGGRQMPSHWGDRERHIVTQSSPTASQCLPAVGSAEASRYFRLHPDLAPSQWAEDELTYVSLGEGSTAEGEFWESINTASRLRLPLLYLVEDNGYAISVRSSDQLAAPVSDLMRSFKGLSVYKVQGWDYAACRDIAARATAHVRSGAGPALIHAQVTRPYSHSSSDDQSRYRTVSELSAEASHDPIEILERQLISSNLLTADQAAGIKARARQLVSDAADEALCSLRPEPSSVSTNVTGRSSLPVSERLQQSDEPNRRNRTGSTPRSAEKVVASLVMADAIRSTLGQECEYGRVTWAWIRAGPAPLLTWAVARAAMSRHAA